IDEVSIVPIKDSNECDCNKLKLIKDLPNNYEMASINPIVLKNIHFNSGKSELLPNSDKELDRLVSYLKFNQTLIVEINGHTDSLGNISQNMKLSEQRAKAVYNYLISKGIDSKRLVFKGYGSSQPKHPNNSEKNREINRRVEILFKK
ncbi:MAG: OmpA family protein, partial [Bacteroidia bacterium]